MTFEEVFTEAGIIPQWIEQGIERGKMEIIDLLKSGKSPEEIIMDFGHSEHKGGEKQLH